MLRRRTVGYQKIIQYIFGGEVRVIKKEVKLILTLM